MAWRVAYSLDQLRKQVQLAWPERSRVSDGTIGDANHQKRTSDHNPWVPPPHGGVVTALDLTHDPANGADMHVLTEALRASRDPRIKYVIWDGRIMSGSGGPVPWAWRNYTGRNQHHSHAHFSVVSHPASLYDSTKPWALPGQTKQEDTLTPELKHHLEHMEARLNERIDARVAEAARSIDKGRNLAHDTKFTREGVREVLRALGVEVVNGPPDKLVV